LRVGAIQMAREGAANSAQMRFFACNAGAMINNLVLMANGDTTFGFKVNILANITSSSTSTGSLIVSGGLGVTGNIFAGNKIESRGVTAICSANGIGGGIPIHALYINDGLVSYISDNSSAIIVHSNAGGSVGQFIAHNASAWSALSDARLPYKKAAREITDRLPPLDHYRLYENANEYGIVEVFAKAQEVDALFPQLVHRGSDDPDYEPTGMSDLQAWGLSYDRMGAIALAYIKQLTARVDAIERRH
jgi:hypothetical protein